jgi:hypothetical protein
MGAHGATQHSRKRFSEDDTSKHGNSSYRCKDKVKSRLVVVNLRAADYHSCGACVSRYLGQAQVERMVDFET